MGIPVIGAIIKLIGKLLGIAKKIDLLGKIQKFILEAEKLRNKTGPEKFEAVLKAVMENKEVKKHLENIKAKAKEAGLDADKLFNEAYDRIKAEIQAAVDALNALGVLLPHKTKPVTNTAYAVTVPREEMQKLGSNLA